MESPMEVESTPPTGGSVKSLALSSKGWVKMTESGKSSSGHSSSRQGYILTLNDDDDTVVPGDESSKQLEDFNILDGMASLMFDKTCRRSSLGADSLLDQDFTEDVLDSEGAFNISAPEELLGLQYADDIYGIKKKLEVRYHPTNCMADQPQVTEYMRCTLVHWLIKVNHQLQFGPETVFIAVNIADRFLAVMPLAQDCLQLLAVVSLFVAAKMEESIVPGISELVAMCRGTYKPHHFRRMEVLILSTLEYVLYGPTSWYFLEHLTLKASLICSLDRRVVSVARYVLETCLSNYEVSQFLPSVQAAGAMLMSINTVSCSPVHLELLEGLMKDLYTEAESQDTAICSSLMSRYMAPFLAFLDPDQQNFAQGYISPDHQDTDELVHNQFPGCSSSSPTLAKFITEES